MKEIPVENCHECLFLLMVYCRVYDRKIEVEDVMQYRKPDWCSVVGVSAKFDKSVSSHEGPPRD